MGRHYSGDIEGRFMFAVQSSVAADRFGAKHNDPGYVEYYFDEDELVTLKSELEKLKPNYDVVNDFFEKRRSEGLNCYSQDDLKNSFITEQMISDYADYNLGKKIKDCIEEQGSCRFSAEL
tara:strand:- start:84 stop:446 length:363 start_codon:yes stop_codon:yes gene_type:complete